MKEEGIDLHTVIMASTPGLQAVLAGEMDFTGSGSSALVAVTQGNAPLKTVLAITDQVLQWLMVRPQYAAFKDLKHKKIAVTGVAAVATFMLKKVAPKYGVDANKELTFLALPPGQRLASAEFALILEDMAPARQGDQLAGCLTAEAALALEELAKLHAPRWADERLAALPWLNRNTPDALAASSAMLPALLPGFLARYAARLAPDEVGVAERLMGSLGRWFGLREPPFAIQHGDYRIDNMLFGTASGGPPLAVVDWQTALWGPPVADVAYFLGASLPTETRRASEPALVRAYWDALGPQGARGLSWDRCWSDYRKFAFGGLLMAICASMLVVQTPRGDDMFVTMARRHARHVLDLDALELLPA